MKRILVPTDFSDNSKAAFPYAIEQVKNAGPDSTLHVLCVIEDLAPTSVQFEFALAVIDTQGIMEEAHRKASEKLAELVPEAFPGIATEQAAVKAKTSTAREIVQYAEAQAIDLIVMGTHGRSGFQRALLGSVAESVLREAPCPILLVPNRGKDS